MSDRIVDCHEDAMAFLRRGPDGVPERNRYVAHLRVCDDCYAAYLAARCFDATGDVRPGDEQRVRRAVDGALAVVRAPAPQPRIRRVAAQRPAFALAAAAVLVTAAAASAGILVHQRREAQRRVEEAASTGGGGRRHHPDGHAIRKAEPPPLPRLIESTPPSIEPSPEPGPPSNVAVPSRRSAVSVRALHDVATPRLAARDLFTAATAARQRRRVDDAIAAFQRLQREFPGTAEATVSLVSLAQLLADRGRPADALALFDAYLAKAPSGPLAPEALDGRARMLDRLGRTDEARPAREQIRRRFPASPYSPAP